MENFDYSSFFFIQAIQEYIIALILFLSSQSPSLLLLTSVRKGVLSLLFIWRSAHYKFCHWLSFLIVLASKMWMLSFLDFSAPNLQVILQRPEMDKGILSFCPFFSHLFFHFKFEIEFWELKVKIDFFSALHVNFKVGRCLNTWMLDGSWKFDWKADHL